jgi:maltooligosyltrehalose trehalohydrolase
VRNWGYDGVCLFAPARAYGGAEGLRRLVDAAHAHGLAVLLDVVYNHLGPDGNYLWSYSHDYFTSRHRTPWGDALNFDGPRSRPVRDFFIANALHWVFEYHLDGLRLDATHAIIDDSPVHLVAELAATLRASLPLERHVLLIAEHGANDPLVVRASEPGDWGLDGIWADDFHHQVHVALTGEREGYFAAYTGSAADLARTIRQGWFYVGQVAPNTGQPQGAPADDILPSSFVYCIQNHDQVGNRAFGERLHHVVSLAAYRAVSALLLLCPQTPLLWMGQEWAASTPFLFFTDHNPELGRMVTEGRRKEFARFVSFSGADVPDPQDPETFVRSRLRWDEREREPHRGVLQLYADLLALRRTHPALRERRRETYTATPVGEAALALRREGRDGEALLLAVALTGMAMVELGDGPWSVVLDTEAAVYGGSAEPVTLEGDELRLEGPRAVLLERGGGEEARGEEAMRRGGEEA